MEPNDMSQRFSPSVLQKLNAAGWYEGRSVEVPEGLAPAPFPAAYVVLREFGGLHVGEVGPGLECATSDVHIDPTIAAHLSPELIEYGQRMDTQLFVLGEFHRSHGYLVIDIDGKTYLLNDSLIPFADSFPESLEKLLLGLSPDSE